MKPLALHEVHAALGARFTEIEGWEVCEAYGDVKAEHLAVRNRAGLSDLSYRGRLRVTGPDRAKFLQGLLTNDVLKLAEGQGLYAALLNAKGRMLADMKVYALPDALILDLDREIMQKTFDLLNRYRLVSKATLEDMGDSTVQLGIHGPEAGRWLEKVLGKALPPEPVLSHTVCPWQGHGVHVIRSDYTGEEGFDLIAPAEAAAALWKALWEAGAPAGLQALGHAALESLRVEAGIPRYGPDMNENTFPPEAGLEEKAISYTKGCYMGQETIARIKTYGQVHRKLVGVALKDVASPEALPQHDDRILREGQEIGFVTSAAFSPVLDRPIALAYVQRKAFGPDIEVVLSAQDTGKQFPAQLVELPFYKRQEVSSP